MSAQQSDGSFIWASTLSAIEDDTAIRVDIDGVPICLARSGGGVYALVDRCSHADIPLSEGDVEDGTVECWLHGSRFDLRTGRPTGLPATSPVRTFPTRIDGDDVFVALS